MRVQPHPGPSPFRCRDAAFPALGGNRGQSWMKGAGAGRLERAGAAGGRKSCWIRAAFLTSHQGSVVLAEPAGLRQRCWHGPARERSVSGPILQVKEQRGDIVGHMQVLPRGMAADVHKKKGWEVPNGSLAPGDGQHAERSESPTPGLAQGTEPGTGAELTAGVSGERGEGSSSSSCRLGSLHPAGRGRWALWLLPTSRTHTPGCHGMGREGQVPPCKALSLLHLPSTRCLSMGDRQTDTARPIVRRGGPGGSHVRAHPLL